MMDRLRSASTKVSTCVVPLPLPLAVLAGTYQPVGAPMLKPISPLPLLFFDDCVCSSVSLRRVMLCYPPPILWWHVCLELELETPMPMPMPMRRLTPSMVPEAPCSMAPPTPVFDQAGLSRQTRH